MSQRIILMTYQEINQDKTDFVLTIVNDAR